MPIFYNDMPLNKADMTSQMSDPTVGNTPPKEPDPVPWSPTDHPVFMPKEDMYMISGDNPKYDPNGSEITPESPFRSRNTQLVEKLQQMSRRDPRIQFEVGDGRYNGTDEQSVLLKGLPVADVMKLAKEHGQESFVHLPPYPQAHKMVYANGPHANEHEHGIRENTKTFAQPPSDYFTFLPSLGKYLRLDFNWGNYHPNDSKDSCPDDTGGPQGEPAMKSEKTVVDAAKAIAELLKKEIKQHEDFLVELRKADMEKKSPPGHEKQVEHIAASYEEEGKSAGQAKAIAAATAWKQHKEHGEHKKGECCKKCGKAECMGKCDMSDVKKAEPCKKCGMKMEGPSCKKCDMSDVHMEKGDDYGKWSGLASKKSAKAKETDNPYDHHGAAHAHTKASQAAKGKFGRESKEASHHAEQSAEHTKQYKAKMTKSEIDLLEIAQFVAVADAMSKAEGEKKGAKRLQDDPQSLTDGGEGPKETPESKEVSAPGSGNDPKAGKPEKAPSMKKSVHNIKGENSAEHSEESGESKEKSKKEESSSVSKSLDLIIDLVKAFDHRAPMPHVAHAAPSLTAPAHAPVAKVPQTPLHTHPMGGAVPTGAVHGNPMQGKVDALKHRVASMKKPKIPSVK